MVDLHVFTGEIIKRALRYLPVRVGSWSVSLGHLADLAFLTERDLRSDILVPQSGDLIYPDQM